MFSELNLFGYTMGTFSFCLGIGMVCGILFIVSYLKKTDASLKRENAVMAAIPLTFICGTFGAHLADVVLRGNLQAIIEAPLAYGLTFYGWLVAASAFLIIYSKAVNISSAYLFNLFTPAFAIGQAVGRIGCFLGGCCYGCPGTPGVVYPPDSLPYKQYGSTPLIPVQIYESICLLFIFVILIKFIRFKHRGAMYLIMLSVERFILEFFRADDRGELLNDVLSPSQWISIGLFFASSTVCDRSS